MKRLLLRWLPALLWMGLIFLLSSQPDLPHWTTAPLEAARNALAHLGEYAVLAVLLLRAGEAIPSHSRSWLFPVLLTLLYAVSDELHQQFVPGRTASSMDLALDVAGAGVGSFLFWRFSLK